MRRASRTSTRLPLRWLVLLAGAAAVAAALRKQRLDGAEAAMAHGTSRT